MCDYACEYRVGPIASAKGRMGDKRKPIVDD